MRRCKIFCVKITIFFINTEIRFWFNQHAKDSSAVLNLKRTFADHFSVVFNGDFPCYGVFYADFYTEI